MIKKEIEIIEYDNNKGLQFNWEEGFTIKIMCDNGLIEIIANEAGLCSLANHLLNLAQEGVPFGTHIHLDEYNSLEEGSCEIIIEKADI